MKMKKQKIFVGISGGVDSSVAAYLLKKEGHDVQGVFVKTWTPEWLPCTWLSEKRDAMRVCAQLDIPFHFLDAEAAYKKGVAESMIESYKKGYTPNPDVLCNREIKFGVLWDYVKAHGGDALATGHYAQTDGKNLFCAEDSAKDQVYFLWMLTTPELVHIHFPLGKFQKKEVRAIAKKAGLCTATKKESQGICFLGDIDMKAFLKHYIDESPGKVVNEAVEVVGTHDGVLLYTLGERHGFTITEKTAHRAPYFVTGKDVQKNILFVSHTWEKPSEKSSASLTLTMSNFFQPPDPTRTYHAQLRYHGTRHEVQIHTLQNATIHSREPIACGQSIVFYDGEKVIGGAIIEAVSE